MKWSEFQSKLTNWEEEKAFEGVGRHVPHFGRKAAAMPNTGQEVVLGGGVKLKIYETKKKPKINSVGWQHTRVDNKQNKQSQGRSLLQYRIPSSKTEKFIINHPLSMIKHN